MASAVINIDVKCALGIYAFNPWFIQLFYNRCKHFTQTG
jgi:hypothetical protein